jgi:hypothetical protein
MEVDCRNVLNFLKVQKIDLEKLLKTMSVEQVKEKLGEIIDGCFEAAKELKVKSGGYITLERGVATIPLPGIDVPFHSRYLWAGVLPFRTQLVKKLDPERLDLDLLIGKYIPNLIAEPFEISKTYAEKSELYPFLIFFFLIETELFFDLEQSLNKLLLRGWIKF